jgi:class 3 adenylate cyclase
MIETTSAWRVVGEHEDASLSEEQIRDDIDGFGRAFGQPSAQQELFELTAPSHRGDGELYRFMSKLERYAASPSSSMGFLTLLFHTDIGGILDSIHVPTQVLHRADDRLLPVRYGRQLADRIAGASFVELPGGDWWPFLGDTEPLHAALETFVLGAPVDPPGVAATRALATVLVTDIVGSTARAARDGDDAWGDVRRQHDDVVRHHLAGAGGVEIKTMGDGFLITFEGPAAAVRCARAIADDVRALGIHVRAGLHTGEVIFEGGDIAGLGVAIAARVGSLAGPDEVLVSQTVKDLVAGSGLTFEDAGEHELKGVPDTWRLYRVPA